MWPSALNPHRRAAGPRASQRTEPPRGNRPRVTRRAPTPAHAGAPSRLRNTPTQPPQTTGLPAGQRIPEPLFMGHWEETTGPGQAKGRWALAPAPQRGTPTHLLRFPIIRNQLLSSDMPAGLVLAQTPSLKEPKIRLCSPDRTPPQTCSQQRGPKLPVEIKDCPIPNTG